MDKLNKQFFTANIKQVSDTGIFEVIASTDVFDREGESINPEGWELENYKKNPVILWSHDVNALPIGKATSVHVEDGKLIIEGEFASKEANPMAHQVRLLVEAGIQRAVSVGFIPLDRDGDTITKQELLELSFVPVPANPEALALAKEKNLDMRLFKKTSIGVGDAEVVVDEVLKQKLLYNNAPANAPYSRQAFINKMKKYRKSKVKQMGETEEVIAFEFDEIASEIVEAVQKDIEQALPALEEATEKQLEGEAVVMELLKEVAEIVEKNLDAEVTQLANDVEEVVEESEEGKQAEEVEAEVEQVVELSFEEIATDITDQVSKALEEAVGDIMETVDEDKRKQAEETVTEVVAEIEKNIEEDVVAILEKNVEPVVSEATSAAKEAVGDEDDDEKAEDEDDEDDEDEDEDEDEDKKGGHEDDEDEDKEDEDEDEDKRRRRN